MRNYGIFYQFRPVRISALLHSRPVVTRVSDKLLFLEIGALKSHKLYQIDLKLIIIVQVSSEMTRHLNTARFLWYRPLHFPSLAKINKTKILLIMWNVGHVVNFFYIIKHRNISRISSKTTSVTVSGGC